MGGPLGLVHHRLTLQTRGQYMEVQLGFLISIPNAHILSLLQPVSVTAVPTSTAHLRIAI